MGKTINSKQRATIAEGFLCSQLGDLIAKPKHISHAKIDASTHCKEEQLFENLPDSIVPPRR